MKNKIFLYGFSFGIQFFITIFISVLTVKYYSSNIAADLFYQLNLVTYFTTLFSLGVPQALLRFQYIQTVDAKILKNTVSIVGVVSVIGLAVFCVLLLDFNSVFLVLLVPFTFSQYFLRSVENFNRFIVLFLIRLAIIILGATIIFYTNSKESIWWYVTIGISFSVGILFYPSFVNFRIDRRILSSLLKYSIPLQLYSFLLQGVFLFGQILLERFGQKSEFEDYVITWRVIQILQAVGGLIFFFYPQFYFKNIESNKERVIYIRNFIFLFLCLIGILLLLFKPIIDIIFGIEFSYHILTILVISEVIRLVTGINNTKFSFLLKNKYLLYSLLFSVVLSSLALLIAVIYNHSTISSITVAYSILSCFVLYSLSSIYLRRKLSIS